MKLRVPVFLRTIVLCWLAACGSEPVAQSRLSVESAGRHHNASTTPLSAEPFDPDNPLVGLYRLEGVDGEGAAYTGTLMIEPASVTINREGFITYLSFLISVTLPLLIGALLLNWFLVNLLIGVREYYADQRALQSVSIHSLVMGLKRVREIGTFAVSGRRSVRLAPVGHIALVPAHPTPASRWRAMHDPRQIFTPPWQIGITVWGVVAVFYSLSTTILASVSARQPDTLIPVTLAFVLLANGLTPHLVLHLPDRPFWKSIAAAVGGYWLLLLVGHTVVMGIVTVILYTMPDIVPDSVALLNRLLQGVQLDERMGEADFLLDLLVIRPLLFTLIATPGLLTLALIADTWLKRLVLCCYAAPWSVRQRKWLLGGGTLVVAFLIQSVVVPLISWPFFPDFITARELEIGILAGIALLSACVWSGLLWRWWRAYGQRCPGAKQHRVTGAYAPTATCPACGVPLIPWLTVSPQSPDENVEPAVLD